MTAALALQTAALFVIGIAPATGMRSASPDQPIGACRAIDGDTLRCGNERIRLLGIDAPELPGHCRRGRVCVIGDPYSSQRSLAVALIGRLRILRVKQDRYGRTLALVTSNGRDLSCWQIRRGQAVYRADWDDGRRLASVCANNGKNVHHDR